MMTEDTKNNMQVAYVTPNEGLNTLLSGDSSRICFNLNGEDVAIEAAPMERLTRVLRDNLGMTGTKVGCDAGDCGACTVLLDGAATCACMVPVGRLEGHSIVTVEGLEQQGTLSNLQRSFLHYGAAQCGICTPGMLMSAVALLDQNPKPSESEVEDALGGVLCRCTGYRKIITAVMHATEFDQQALEARKGSAVGARINRVDGVAKVNGTDIFGADEAPEETLLVKVIRSPHHHARFEFGDFDTFIAAHPGLLRVFTAKDIPGENKFGVIPDFADQPVFAVSESRFKGEAVAAIVGEVQAINNLDLSEFPVTWAELPAVLTSEDAQAEDAPELHEDRADNVLTGGFVQKGDVDQSAVDLGLSCEGEFETGFIEHAYIEPEAGFARRVGDQLEIQACTQAAHMDRDALAGIMGLAKEDIRIIPTAVGGGFGSKLDVSLQPYVALAAWYLNRPARIEYTRAESMMTTTKRHPSRIKTKISVTGEGKLSAMDFHGIFNTGAYASWGPTVANRVPVHASGPYYFPNYRAQSVAVHTHCPPAGAFRGFGVPQSAIAQETLFDELADKVGLDRLEFRILNALENGMPTVTGQVFESGVGFKKCLLALQPHWHKSMQSVTEFNRNSSDSKRRGIGVAGVWYGCGNTSLPNPSTIKVGITDQGKLELFQGAADIGQGANTVITQICADALGLAVDQFELVCGDTDITPDAGKTSASRQTFVTGKAAFLAGEKLRETILSHVDAAADAELDLNGQELVVSCDGIDRVLRLDDLPADSDGFVFLGQATYDPPTSPMDENGQGDPYATFGYGAHMLELEVDRSTGKVELLNIIAAHDVGRAINPVLTEGQVEGGIAQGIGLALMEEFVPGRTENLHDYLIPTIGDIPPIETIIIEDADPHGPFGAKGLGEHVLIPTAPAILNAIRHATGAIIRKLPATPERVLEAIKVVNGGGSL